MTNPEFNTVRQGDCLDVLQGFNSECVDLIYLDPPFCTQKDWGEFDDRWQEGEYITWMELRLREMHRVLKPTGSIYLHCDPTMSHYLKLVMDTIFGISNFRNEIVWHYSNRLQRKAKPFAKLHDIILVYSKTTTFTSTPVLDDQWKPSNTQTRRLKTGFETRKGVLLVYNEKVYEEAVAKFPNLPVQIAQAKQPPIGDVWVIPILNPAAKERTGYATQKPLALLRRIIAASSNEGDIVLDPFCGSGTTLVAAQLLNRKWIGIDVSKTAVELATERTKAHQTLELVA